MSVRSEEADPVHEIRKGQQCHVFVKHEAIVQLDVDVRPRLQMVYLCDCGEMRDRFGHPIKVE